MKEQIEEEKRMKADIKSAAETIITPEMNKDGTYERCRNCGNKTIIKKDTAYPFYYEILPVGQLRCTNCHCIILNYGDCSPEDLVWNDIMETVECTPERWGEEKQPTDCDGDPIYGLAENLNDEAEHFKMVNCNDCKHLKGCIDQLDNDDFYYDVNGIPHGPPKIECERHESHDVCINPPDNKKDTVEYWKESFEETLQMYKEVLDELNHLIESNEETLQMYKNLLDDYCHLKESFKHLGNPSHEDEAHGLEAWMGEYMSDNDEVYYCPICTSAWWKYDTGGLGGSEIPNKEYPFETEHKICPPCNVEHHERELEKMRKHDDTINIIHSYYCPICENAWWAYEDGSFNVSEIPSKNYPWKVEHMICPVCDRIRTDDDYINPPDEELQSRYCTINVHGNQHKHQQMTRESIKREKTALALELKDTIDAYKVGPNQRIGYVDVIGILELLKQKYYTKYNRGHRDGE